MVLRAVRALERGKAVPFVAVMTLGVCLLVWFAAASGQQQPANVAIRAAGSLPVDAVELVAGASVVLTPDLASTAAAEQASWRGDLEIHNPGPTQASFTVALLDAGSGAAARTAVNLLLAPGSSRRYADVIDSFFHRTGAAAIRITMTTGSLLISSDTFRLPGRRKPGGGPARSPQGRSAAALAAGHATTSRDPRRVDRPATSGYAAVEVHAQSVDNQVNRRLRRTGPATPTPTATATRTPTPTATPTPTPTPTPTSIPEPDLTIWQPPDWPGCIVCNNRAVGPPPITESLATGNNATFIYWALLNDGAATVTEPITFGFYLDAVLLGKATWANTSGLQGGWAVTFNPVTTTVLTPGQHTLAIMADPDDLITESDETNNTCEFTGTWTGAPATPTPTPTPTPPTDLGMFRPPGWGNCVVCNFRQVGPPPITESLATGNNATFVYWSIVNWGTASVTQPVVFGFYLDGALLLQATWDPVADLGQGGLLGGYYVVFNPITLSVPMAGQHTLSVKVDKDDQIPDADRSDNTCGFTGTWTGASATPTPTPTPQPANPIDAAGWVMGNLLPQVAANFPPLDNIVGSVLTSGIGPLINQFVAGDPIHRIPLANGASLVFGSTPVTTQYGVFTGSTTVTFSNFQAGTTSFTTNYSYSATADFTANGQRNAITQATGQITASQSSVGTLAAGSIVTTTLDVTVSGSGSNPPASESGYIHVDTAKCLNYPVAGAINIVFGGNHYEITFNDKCDGSFGSRTNPPTQSCTAGQQVAGGDDPDTRFFDMGRTSGTFKFDYDTYYIKDRIQVKCPGQNIYDTGCVGEGKTGVDLQFNCPTAVIEVTVIPNCEPPSTGTGWEYTVHCPQ